MIIFVSVKSYLLSRTNMSNIGGTRNYTESDHWRSSHQSSDNRQHQQQQQPQQEFVGPTLCISRTHKGIRESRVFAVFRQLKLGWVGKIEIVPKQTVEKNPDGTLVTKEFVRIFIHFNKWFTENPQTQMFLERLHSEGFVHIIYDEPWFWKVTKYVPVEQKPQPQSRYPKPRIDFGATASVKKIEPTAAASQVQVQIVPVQVTRHLKNVGVTSEGEKQSYWQKQAETATVEVMTKYQSTSPTPRSHGSDSESSPSPVLQRKVSVRLFGSSE